MKTSSVYEIPANKYNNLLAEALKQVPEFKQPEWSLFVKTGIAKKRPPQEKDFWYKRAASILRQIYINRIVGVNRLKTRYGSKKNRGFKPERFKKASGKIIRTILQQAEVAGLLEKYAEPGKRAGRQLTEKGKEFLEGVENKPKEEKPIIEQPISNESSSDEESSLIKEEEPKKDNEKEIIEKQEKKPIASQEKSDKPIAFQNKSEEQDSKSPSIQEDIEKNKQDEKIE